VVIHDPHVGRTTDGSGWVHEMTFEELRAVNAGSPDRPEPVPTFREVLDTARGRGGLVVEIKNIPGEPAYEQDRESIVQATVAEVDASGFDGPIVLISFNPRSIAAAKASAPTLPTGLLFTGALDPEAALSIVVDGGHEFVFPAYRSVLSTDGQLVDRAHAEGRRVGTWTVDEPRVFRRLLDRGVDAVASNDPAMGLEVLAEWQRSDRDAS
jgi:glycerophosphoryl diester phosphodiesterase